MIVMEDASRQPTSSCLVIWVLFYMGSDATSLCGTTNKSASSCACADLLSGKPKQEKKMCFCVLFFFFAFPPPCALCLLRVAVALYRVSLTQLTPDIYPS